MTSGVFKTVLISSIFIDRDHRQRKKLVEVEELAKSIKENGLLHPPVVTPELKLVAGERRLCAMGMLGWLETPVQLTTDLDELSLKLLELEENTKRVDLSWTDHNDAVAEYHRLRLAKDSTWNQSKTAAALGVVESTISAHLLVADQKKKSTDIATADKMSVALNIARRKQEREKSVALQQLDADIPLTPVESEPRFVDLLNTNFIDWSSTYSGAKFNLIHCDFPYGVNTGDKKGQSAAKYLGSYDDGEDVYFTLLDAMAKNLDKFCADEAHLMFWYSMKFHNETVEALTSMGWKVDPFPFIWLKSDNTGMLPDPNRGPRRIYETALFASRGDRKIVRPVANAIALPTTKDYHTSEKSFNMLSHFFRMLIDDTTRLLDPTCGSGMAIKAAEVAGASFSLGLELNPDFYELAKKNCGL